MALGLFRIRKHGFERACAIVQDANLVQPPAPNFYEFPFHVARDDILADLSRILLHRVPPQLNGMVVLIPMVLMWLYDIIIT